MENEHIEVVVLRLIVLETHEALIVKGPHESQVIESLTSIIRRYVLGDRLESGSGQEQHLFELRCVLGGIHGGIH